MNSTVQDTSKHAGEANTEDVEKATQLSDYYKCLGVSTSATTSEIVAAYRKRARNIAGLPTSHPRYLLTKKAYDVLSDEASRREYDKAIKPDLYEVLGLGRGANLREIIVAYRKLARVNHPDKGGEQRAFDLITEAYRVLSDPDKRCEYDRNGFTSDELERPSVRVEAVEGKGRGVVATREVGMGEVVLGRERPFAAVLSEDEGAYKSYCHNCLISLATRRTKEKCGLCGAHYCAKPACGLHCEQHQRECCFIGEWKQSDLCIYQAAERPRDKLLFLLHAVFNGGLVFEQHWPLVPIKATPLQLHVSELCDNAGRVERSAAEQNLEYATYMSDFLEAHGAVEDEDEDEGGSSAQQQHTRSERVRELIKLLRFYDANAVPVRDAVRGRNIAKGLYLSLSLFNHSCNPNCAVSFEGDSASVRTTRLVAAGEELCVAYVDPALPRVARQAQLSRHWRFTCECVKCESSHAEAREKLLHGTFCPFQDCRGLLEKEEEEVEAKDDDGRSDDHHTSASANNGGSANDEGNKTNPCGSTGGEGGGSGGPTNSPQGSRPQPDYRPNALTVTSVPYVDQSFLPSMAGYLGDREGYVYRDGRHGPGYYQEEDEYGYPISKRGDDLGLHRCRGCGRMGADVYMQQALVLTAERHKFFYTHKQPALDPRIAAFEAVTQLRQVANLELACLHPLHPSVAETLRVVHRMHAVLGQHAQSVAVLRVLALRDELAYGVVAEQTAHSAWLLADALLNRSSELEAKAQRVVAYSPLSTLPPVPPSLSTPPARAPAPASPATAPSAFEEEEAAAKQATAAADADAATAAVANNAQTHAELKAQALEEASHRAACEATEWAQKALQIMAVLFGRNHEVTYAAHVTLDLAHFRVEHVEKKQVAARALEMAECEKVAAALTSGEVETAEEEEQKEETEATVQSDSCGLEGDLSNAPHSAAPTATTTKPGDSVAATHAPSVPSLKPASSPCVGEQAAALELQCPTCASLFPLPALTRLAGCPNCGHFCTALHAFDEAAAAADCELEQEEEDPAGSGGSVDGGSGDGGSGDGGSGEQVAKASRRLKGDAFGSMLRGILRDCHAALNKPCSSSQRQLSLHRPGDMLPSQPVADFLYSSTGLSPTRAGTCGMDLYDANLRGAIAAIARNHREEWHPCDVCGAPRADKRCSGCKVARYCSLHCAMEDFKGRGHKELCKRLLGERKAALGKAAATATDHMGSGLFAGLK